MNEALDLKIEYSVSREWVTTLYQFPNEFTVAIFTICAI
jgi:hypothetical protein